MSDWSITHVNAYCDDQMGQGTLGNYLEVAFGSTDMSGWWDLARGTYSYGSFPPDVLHIVSVECWEGRCLDVGVGSQNVVIQVMCTGGKSEAGKEEQEIPG